MSDRIKSEYEAKRLTLLFQEAKRRFDELTPEQQSAHRREQRISWVYGQLGCMRKGPQLTREQVAELIDKHDQEAK